MAIQARAAAAADAVEWARAAATGTPADAATIGMPSTRVERDALGQLPVPADAYWGIHTARALENFPLSGQPIHPELVDALVTVKKAAALTNRDVGLLAPEIADAIVAACDEILAGALRDQFVVDKLQGGAGTSANMNANEVIANRAIELLGGELGEYERVHPLDHVNLSQSTNDVFPTAVRIAAIRMLKRVSERFAQLQSALQGKESEFADVLKCGRTQLQDALPVTLGQEFGAWAQAVSRDRWRLYKAEERLRQVGLGGTAVGTGVNAPKAYIFGVIERLRDLTGIGLARAEYMMDPIQNCDVFVEVSGLLKASAVTLSKIANDLRLLSSGPRAGLAEITLPAVQAGSSIMPGKVNPVIPEAVNQVAFQVMADDLAITLAASAGQLELNAFLPQIAANLLEQLDLLEAALPLFTERCIAGISANREHCAQLAEGSLGSAAALMGVLGYERAAALAHECAADGRTLREVLEAEGSLSPQAIERILDPATLTSPGASASAIAGEGSERG
jgi:aspartate ammonia-lyase